MMYELAEDPAATRFAIAHCSGPPRPPLAASDRLILSPAARIASFDHDVTATPPTRRPRPLHLLAVKSPDRWGPKIYQLSGRALEILRLCDGERSLTEMISSSADSGPGTADVPAALNQFAGSGALISQPHRPAAAVDEQPNPLTG